MNVSDFSLTAPAVLDGARAVIARVSPSMVMRVLLVTANEDHVAAIKSAAEGEGWQAVRHRLADQARRASIRTKFHLALVDTQSVEDGPRREEYEQLAVNLSQGDVPLIVISGEAGDPLGEIRARQLGVWLYLPGFDGTTELDLVFREARLAHEKTQANAEPDSEMQDWQREARQPRFHLYQDTG